MIEYPKIQILAIEYVKAGFISTGSCESIVQTLNKHYES